MKGCANEPSRIRSMGAREGDQGRGEKDAPRMRARGGRWGREGERKGARTAVGSRMKSSLEDALLDCSVQ